MYSPSALAHVPPDIASLLSERCLDELGDIFEKFSQILGGSADVFARSRANSSPNSPSEMNVYNSFAETAQTALSKCDKFLADIDRLASRLKSQRIDVARAMGVAQSLSSPVRKLPLEILSEIFDIHCSMEPSLRTVSYEAVTSSTLDLAHTCSFWRQATVSRPSYWRSLSIDMNHVTESSAFTDYILDFITRSGHSGLLLHIEGLDTELEEAVLPTSQRVRVLDFLVRNALRWQTAVLTLSDELLCCLQEVQSGSTQFSMLQSLDCSKCWDDISMDEYHPFAIFRNCSKLERFSTKYLWRSHPLDTSHITHLSLRIYFGHSLAELLTRSPRLQSCDVRFRRWFELDELPPPFDDNTPIIHDLSDLRLRSDGSLQIGTFPSSLYLPKLASLNVEWMRDEAQVTGITQLISRSQCALKSLTLLGWPSKYVTQVLVFTPTLLDLHVSTIDSEAELDDFRNFIASLTSKQGQCMVPKVVSLGIEVSSAWEASVEFCEMIESRCTRIRNPGAVDPGLQTVRLKGIDTPPDIYTRLKSYRKAGLVVERIEDRQDG